MADWTRLTEPFLDSEVKQRPGPGNRTLNYVDARTVANRLDEVLTPGGWDFTCEVASSEVVKGRLVIYDGPRQVVREDHGYPNSDRDEEPIKAATSDALKRCAVMFGIGRHLYQDNTASGGRSTPPVRPPTRPQVVQNVARPTVYVPEEPEGLYGDLPEQQGDTFPPIGNPANAVAPSHCPIHDVPWAGQAGDYWHGPKGIVDGGFCRHPDNIKRPRRAS